MPVIIKKTGHLTAIKQLKAHIKYIGFRSQEIEREEGDIYKFPKGHFFNSNFDNVNFKSFVKNIEENKALRYKKSVKAHKFIFSLNEYNYDKYIQSGKDYKDLIRKTFSDYERKHGVKLDWIATEHRVDGEGKSNHPHCHVVISGVSQPDKDGKVTRIFFKKEDFKELRENFDKELRKEIGTDEREYQSKEFRDFDRSILKDIGKGFDMVTKEIDKDIRRTEAEKLARNRSEQKARQRADKERNERDR